MDVEIGTIQGGRCRESCLPNVISPICCGSLINKKFDIPIILETQMTVAEAAEVCFIFCISLTL